MLSVSSQPLYFKLIVGQGFPMISPQIQVMSRVGHKFIEAGTYYYKGPALTNWTQNSQLVAVLKQVQAEFNQEPPMPQRMT